MKTLLLFALLLVPAELVAQAQKSQTTQRRKVVLPQNVQNPASGMQTRGPAQAATPILTENVTLHWLGSVQGMVELDVSLTGCGPVFMTEFAAIDAAKGDLPPPIFSIEAKVHRSGEHYRVDYSIGARIALKTAGTNVGPQVGPQVVTSVEFRDIMTIGSVLVKPGKQIILSKLANKTLTFSLSTTE